jgi:hypothetical protein
MQLLGGGSAVAAAVAADQELGLERDQRAGEGVDLVGRERGAVGQVRLLLRQQPLQPEHERERPPPLDRWLAAPLFHLLQGRVERGTARGVVRESGADVLSFEDKRFAREFLGALQVIAGHRRGFGHGASFSHG